MKGLMQVGVVMLFIFVVGVTGFSIYKTAITYQPDFSIFYLSAKDVLHGISPYNDHHLFTAFNYPLATAIFFIPLTVFPFITAQIIFTLINAFALFLCIYIAFALLAKKQNIYLYLLVAALTLLAFPTKFTFGMGQVNIVAYTFLLGGFLLYKSKKQKASIILLICAVLLKPILGLTLIVFLYERKWKYFFIVLLATISLAILIPFLCNQQSANVLFVQGILQQNVGGREVYYNQGLLGFISRLTTNLLLRNMLNLAATAGIICIIFFKIRTVNFVQKISLLITALLLIDPLSWQHHFVFLLLSFLTVWFMIQIAKSSKGIYYLLYVVSYMLIALNFRNPQQFIHFPFSLLLSNQFYGTFLLFILQLCLL